MYNSASSPTLENVTFSGNSAKDGGVVAFNAPDSGASITSPVSAAKVANGVASLLVTANGVPGSYLVNANTSGAASPVSFSLTNNKLAAQVHLTSSDSLSIYGQSVTFTATLTSAQAHIPTGSVQFRVDGKALGGAVPLSGGSAS